ncbi:Protein of unknown function [Bacillus wiedmannii]
MESVM